MLAGKEVIVPCMVDGNKDDLHLRQGKIQRVQGQPQAQDYNPKRDFVGWGGEDFRRLNGMPGFTHYLRPDARRSRRPGHLRLDFDGDGKPDLCLAGGRPGRRCCRTAASR